MRIAIVLLLLLAPAWADEDTFYASVGADDGYVKYQGECSYMSSSCGTKTVDDSNTGMEPTSWGRASSSEQWYQMLLRFDTSSLPDDATITASSLHMRQSRTTVACQTTGADIIVSYTLDFGVIDTADANADPASLTEAGKRACSDTTSKTFHEWSLSDFSGISKTGNTHLRVWIGDPIPAEDSDENNNPQFNTYESTNDPYLVVTYNSGGGETTFRRPAIVF